jgi:hypothetical protein
MIERRPLTNLAYRLLGSLAEAASTCSVRPGCGESVTSATGSLSRCPTAPSGWAGQAAAARPTRPTWSRIVNGQPGLVAEQDHITVTVFAFDIAAGRITHIWVIRIPKAPAMDEMTRRQLTRR